MTNNCMNCKFCHKLKQLLNNQWIIQSVCTVYPQTEQNSDYEDFAIVVDVVNDTCEMFVPRRGLRADMGVIDDYSEMQ